jgi:hypothetical protein
MLFLCRLSHHPTGNNVFYFHSVSLSTYPKENKKLLIRDSENMNNALKYSKLNNIDYRKQYHKYSTLFI